MSNLIKLKQIAGGKQLRDDVTALQAAVKSEVYQFTTDTVEFDTVITEYKATLEEGVVFAPKAGDMFIITNSLNVKSAYMYDAESGWIACDGAVDASKVMLTQDITLAGEYDRVGTLTKSKTGTATFETEGISVQAALIKMLSQTLQPGTPTNPSTTITLTNAGAKEVGSTFTPSYTTTFEDGKYTYGPEPTGVTATGWTVTESGRPTASGTNGTSTKTSDSFASFIVGDTTSYKLSVSVTHTAGAVAKDNMGSPSNPVKQIAEGTKTANSSSVTGYRSYFYGVLSSSTADAPLTSAIIREQLTNGGNYNEAKSFTLNGSATAKRIVIAIPASSDRGGLSEVILTSAMNTPVTDSYIKTEDAVSVEGVDGYEGALYDVWVYEPSKIDAGEVHAITLA